MKQIIFSIILLITLASCIGKTEKHEEEIIDDKLEELTLVVDTTEVSTVVDSKEIATYSEYKSESNEILPNGKHRFDIAFAEWQGKSLGEKVTVIIDGNLVTVIYEGDGQLTFSPKEEIIDQGQVIKHKSGNWIISNNLNSKELDEIGSCTGGPAIIDFKSKKYWMC